MNRSVSYQRSLQQSGCDSWQDYSIFRDGVSQGCHPVDKRKGFVKAEECVELRVATLASGRFGDRSATRVLYESFSMEPKSFHQPSIRPGTAAMIACSNIPPHAGCEGAHSSKRSSLRRPQDDSGCPRWLRSADTGSGCAASRRAVPPACAPPPQSPRPWACDGSDDDTLF